ncbi:uncharacterized protein (DUF305 family) [Mycetocola sp. CAN_C7]|uniref:DUF305 domain-containing protein n=1 Tax=Mycetocola sp. CAN_C7 TaxID=2787724 RepID=UPI001A2E071A
MLGRILLGGSALAVITVLSACTVSYPMGGGTGPSSQRPADVNQDDLMFVAMMVPHHEQAVEMSDELLGKPDVGPEVRMLAEDIADAQEPEIEQMETWLAEWGMNRPGGMNHSDGMMSDDDLDALQEAEGQRAEVVYLELMIPHHEDAVEMAEDVIAEGENADVRTLAESILESQTLEIAEMNRLLETR